MPRRAFRRFLKHVYDTYIGTELSLKTRRLDFLGRPHALPEPYLVWPLDPLQSRLCGGRNDCASDAEVRWDQFVTDYEETVLRTFGNRFRENRKSYEWFPYTGITGFSFSFATWLHGEN